LYRYSYTFFYYEQVFYKQPQAQIEENLSKLLSTLSASDLVSKVSFLEKLSHVAKNISSKNLLQNIFKIHF